jgi:hypothetical protein
MQVSRCNNFFTRDSNKRNCITVAVVITITIRLPLQYGIYKIIVAV